jgi:hypothetical protein
MSAKRHGWLSTIFVLVLVLLTLTDTTDDVFGHNPALGNRAIVSFLLRCEGSE